MSNQGVVRGAAVGGRLVTPLDRLGAAIVEVLGRQVPWGLVRASNLIRFDGVDREAEKAQRASADLPEVRVVPAGVAVAPHASSGLVLLEASWGVRLATGDDRWALFHAPLVWAVCCAAVDWNAAEAVPGGCDFCHRLEVGPGLTARGGGSLEDPFAESGWATIVTLTAHCRFDRGSMRYGAGA